MKIIHTIPRISEEASGPTYSVTRLCKALISKGADVTLAALDTPARYTDPEFLETFPPGIGPSRLGRSPAMRKWLDGMVSSRQVDLIHNHSLWMMPNVYPGQIAARRKCPYVVSPRGTFTSYAFSIGSRVKKLFWPLVQRPALRAVTCFHATSYPEYLDIRRLGFSQPIAILPNGIDIPDTGPKVPGRRRVLLFLGRIHPNKGLDILLPAWKKVEARFPEWDLHIVGPDEKGYLGDVKKLAQALGAARVKFPGPAYGEEKLRLYGAAELFVLPSYSENFGMAVAEALASGTPAIVTKGAPWDGLGAQKAGWWVETSESALTECLESALSRPAHELAAMGLRGREWMLRDYSWEKIGGKMLETYRWVVSGCARAHRPDWVVID